MSEPGQEPEMDSEGEPEEDEIDLLAYEQDPWDAVSDFFYQQNNRVGACKAHGFLVVGKPGAGKAHLAEKLAGELGAVHLGLPRILAHCVEAFYRKVEHDKLQAQIDAGKLFLELELLDPN